MSISKGKILICVGSRSLPFRLDFKSGRNPQFKQEESFHQFVKRISQLARSFLLRMFSVPKLAIHPPLPFQPSPDVLLLLRSTGQKINF